MRQENLLQLLLSTGIQGLASIYPMLSNKFGELLQNLL